MSEFERLKGFRDFYPPEEEARRKVFQDMKEAVERCGFRKIDSPAVEELDLYRVKSGEGILDETFNFEDHGGREVTLIPELTPSVARMIQQRKDLTKPIKWYSIPRCWRYESPQKGRLREFYQLNCDIVGPDNPETDAEILYTVTEVMRSLGLEDSYRIKINDRRLIESVLDSYGVSEKKAVIETIDDREKLSEEEFRVELKDKGLGDSTVEEIVQLTSISGEIGRKMEDIRDKMPEGKAEEAFSRLEKLVDYLESYGILEKFRIDLSVVRGLDYYTGLVFEGFDRKGDYRAIFGGGRYNGYLDLFGDQELPAIGFGLGDAVLEEIMREEGLWPEEKISTDVYVLDAGNSNAEEAVETARNLREKGMKVEIDLSRRGFSSQLKYADKINAENVVIIGDETSEQEVEVKSMETGEQEVVEKSDLVEYLN